MKANETERPTRRAAFLRIATVGVAILCWAALCSPAFAAAGLKLQRKGAFRVPSGDVRTLSPSACVTASIACNGTVAGALSADDCPYGDGTFYDAWTFEGTAGQHVRIDMAAGWDTWLELYNPSGVKVAFDDDSGGGPDGTNSRIEYDLLVSGTFTIYANSFEEAQTGAYSLQLQCSSVGPPPTCTATATSLCLNNGRFRVSVTWRVPTQGTSGVGTASTLTSDTGYFWFFSSNNIELVIKVVDGRGFNQHFWVFYGALSDVEYTITVTDTVTGAVKTYMNSQGHLASVADVVAFPGGAPGAAEASASTAAPASSMEDFLRGEMRDLAALAPQSASAVCLADGTTLCLNGGRFQVRVSWRVPTQGTSGVGQAVPLTSDTGYFWFFSSNNIELVIKVVDGRAFNQHFWVFYGALSDVEYTITVTDSETGAVRTYTNTQGRLASVADVVAFP
jgi:pre-peptidase